LGVQRLEIGNVDLRHYATGRMERDGLTRILIISAIICSVWLTSGTWSPVWSSEVSIMKAKALAQPCVKLTIYPLVCTGIGSPAVAVIGTNQAASVKGTPAATGVTLIHPG